MPGRIADNILDDVLSRTDIVELVSGYIPLKKAGRNFRANCPFHHEKTPSFMVSPDRQIYHCFGCGAGGNAFGFLMQYERLEFPEAVEMLAKKAGIILPETDKHDSKAQGLAEGLFKINELAANFYEENLNAPENDKPRAYLVKRGINQATAKAFKLGLAPDKWDGLINHLRAKGANLSLLEKSGLVMARESGGFYDRFRNRIIFPIFDVRSRPIGFGARALTQEDAKLGKYINSPETPVYVKGRNLYGLNLTKDAIRDSDSAVVVEGYMDFIVPYQHGLSNIVASLGTALTQDQARLLKRYTQNVVMLYDPDNAGQMATLRSMDIFLEEDMNVRVVSLPQGSDPDLFVRENGIKKLQDLIASSEDLFDYQLRVLKSKNDIKEAYGKKKISSEMLLTIKKVKSEILKAEYIGKLAVELDIPEHYVFSEFNKIKDAKPGYAGDSAQPRKKIDFNPTEKLLIRLMLEENDLIDKVRGCLKPSDFSDQRTSRIVSLMFELLEQGKEIEANTLIGQLPQDDIQQLICESVFMPSSSLEQKDKVIDDCIKRLKSEKVKSERQRLHDQIKDAQSSGDEDSVNRFVEEFHQLIKKEVNKA